MAASPRSNPLYLEHTSQALIAALREADELVREGKAGQELAELVRHATDLLDIIAEGVRALEDPAPGLREAVAAYAAHLENLRAALPRAMLH